MFKRKKVLFHLILHLQRTRMIGVQFMLVCESAPGTDLNALFWKECVFLEDRMRN